MKKLNRKILASMVCALFLMPGLAAAQTVAEQEVNDSISQAQRLHFSSDTVTVFAALGNMAGAAINDTDYYVFQGQEGDVVNVDIDGAYGGTRSFDSVVAIYRVAQGFPMLRMNDDAYPADPGSISSLDSRIDNFRLPATGEYVIAVSNYPRFPQSGGTVSNPGAIANGDYTLIISGVTPEIQQINIDIKPGNTGLAPINPKARGKVPVALLSSKSFNAPLNTNLTSLRFGATGEEASLSHCSTRGEDVNGDGLLDLVCHFDNQLSGFEKGDLEGILRGRTSAGTMFEGRGLLKIVPEKRAQ